MSNPQNLFLKKCNLNLRNNSILSKDPKQRFKLQTSCSTSQCDPVDLSCLDGTGLIMQYTIKIKNQLKIRTIMQALRLQSLSRTQVCLKFWCLYGLNKVTFVWSFIVRIQVPSNKRIFVQSLPLFYFSSFSVYGAFSITCNIYYLDSDNH